MVGGGFRLVVHEGLRAAETQLSSFGNHFERPDGTESGSCGRLT
jgi:hypothetical protein